jgi:hypothetical protein
MEIFGDHAIEQFFAIDFFFWLLVLGDEGNERCECAIGSKFFK